MYSLPATAKILVFISRDYLSNPVIHFPCQLNLQCEQRQTKSIVFEYSIRRMNRKKPKSVNCHVNHQKMILSRNLIVVGENGFFGKLFHRFFGSFWWKFVTFWMWKILSTPVKTGPDKDWLFRPIPQKLSLSTLNYVQGRSIERP